MTFIYNKPDFFPLTPQRKAYFRSNTAFCVFSFLYNFFFILSDRLARAGAAAVFEFIMWEDAGSY